MQPPIEGRLDSWRFLPLVLLFSASGCSALIFEIVWLELLQRVVGSTAVSLAVLLGTFMGGMCLGSVALPRLVSRRRHPLRVFAALELGIGLCAVAILAGMPHVERLYVGAVGHGSSGIVLRGIVCALCLLPPTILMGAGLPAVARWLEATRRGVSRMGWLYCANLAGAVAGCLLAGFYLLRVHDLAVATWFAAAIDGAAALAALALAAASPLTRSVAVTAGASAPRSRWHAQDSSAARPGGAPIAHSTRRSWPVHVAIALSGTCALGAEIIWTRLLALLLGATVYTFSIILAVFLLGLGIGSAGGSLLARATARPRLAFGGCQLLQAAAVGWSAWALSGRISDWPLGAPAASNPWAAFALDLLRCLWVILPATLLWGASFPLALAACAGPRHDPGRLVGGVYAANTLGAIAGAAGFSLVLIPWAGTRQSERVLIGLSVAAALLVLTAIVRPRPRGDPGEPALPRLGVAALGAVLALAAWATWSLPGIPWRVVAYGRELSTATTEATLLEMGEGMNASIAISRLEKVRFFHVSGKVEASSQLEDMRMQRMLAHLPALMHSKPRKALVVGFGAGVTAGSFTLHPDVESIVVCEIEPLIPAMVARHFGVENLDVLRDPRTRMVYDDARHFIATARDSFDVITSDPIHPWVKGNATLYSKEYFELCSRRLNPGGVVAHWLPLYQTDRETVKSEIATFFEVFPNGTLWGNDVYGEGYDAVMIGRADAAPIDVDALARRLGRPDHRAIARSLVEVGFESAVDLVATYAGRASDLRLWLRGAEINRDRSLRLQYLAGMALGRQQSVAIYEELLRQRRFPDALFAASPERSKALRRALQGEGR